MRRLGFLGSSRLAAAQSLLPERIECWRAQWCFFDEQQPCIVECLEESVAADNDWQALSWHGAETQAGSLWLAGNAWRQMLFGQHAGELPDDATATHLLQQARLALANALLEVLELETVTKLTSGFPDSPGAPLGSRLLLRIAIHECQLYCLLDASLFDRFLPQPSVRQPLVQRKDAIGHAKVRLRVNLPLASLAVGDLDDLAPGDVLRARTELDQPLALVTDQGVALANGYLARTGQEQALQLIK